ncbi:MAG: serine/threonine-protein kinase [Planctomycetota bacterium]|jgi:predicted Ser/Thr protein kinase|nr:serine/threonine-protein kinase [Planctomycetota bacterium]
MARRLVELGLMQENVYHPQGNIPTPEELSELLPEFEVESLIGRGGMGAVYRARQKSLERVVAIKVLTTPPDSDGGFAERFQREAQAMASLSHPGIVSVYDFGRAGDLWYIAMELVEGTDLRRVIDTRAVTPREALSIVSQVCATLQYAHDQGVVHRDIKPGNVLLDHDGQVKISDFGLAKLAGARPSATLTRATQVMGTPHYMAPEQVETPLDVDHRADLYSVGVVLYELLTGELPIGNFSLPSQRVQVDVRLDDVVLRAMQKDPPRRYQSATEVRTDVDDVVAHPGSPRTVAGPARRSRAAVIGWSVAACFALTTMLIPLGLIFGVVARPEVARVEMRDLLTEENGRVVSKTIEFDEQGVPRVSAHFASVFDMDPGLVAEADGYLRVQREAYLTQEMALADPHWDKSGGRILVRVDDFARDRSDFVRHTMTLLDGTLNGITIPAPAIEEIERALFPLGCGVSMLAFTNDEEAGLSLRVTSTSEGLGVFEVTGERVLREFGHHLVPLAQPPISVLPNARSLLNALEEIDWNGAQWTVSELRAHQSTPSVESVDPELDAGALDGLQRYYELPDAPPHTTVVHCKLILAAAETSESGISEAFLSEIQSRVMAHIQSHAWCPTSGTVVSGRLVELSQRGVLTQDRRPTGILQVQIGALVSHAPASFAPPGLDLTRLAPGPTLSEAFREAGMSGLTETHSSLRSAPGAFTESSTSLTYEGSETLSGAAETLAVLEGIERAGQAGTVTSLNLDLDATNLVGRSSRRARTKCKATLLIRKL